MTSSGIVSTPSLLIAILAASSACVKGLEHPASTECRMASGFSLRQGCQHPQPVEPLPDCEVAGPDQACFQTDQGQQGRGSYTEDVTNTMAYLRLARSISEADGGGFGTPVSASWTYLEQSLFSEKSLSFFIGASGRTHSQRIRNPVAMNLTSPAKQLLQQDPQQFISLYGLGYIYTIIYGGSFIGSVTLNSVGTADDRDVEAFVGLKTPELFSADGSAEFLDILSQHDVSVSVGASSVGGKNIQQDYRNPETLGNMYADWNASWQAYPAPMNLGMRRWTDLADVQEILNSMPDETRNLFNSPDYTLQVQQEISEESAAVTLVDTSAGQALAWTETRDDPVAESCLTDLRSDARAKKAQIQLLDYASVYAIQQQVLAGNHSWFEGVSLRTQFSECIRGIEDLVEQKRECESSGGHWLDGACEPATTTTLTTTVPSEDGSPTPWLGLAVALSMYSAVVYMAA